VPLNIALARIAALATIGFALPIHHASAQQAPADSACTYRRCALGIAPTWNGLAVVRGVDLQRVANLGFLWPRDISGAFSISAQSGVDSATVHARRAVHLRRLAAFFTDAGLILGTYTVARAAANSRLSTADRALGIGGAVAFGVGVPLQFAADGALSRAVWWYNTRFGR
jgi:hypothetical protein